MSCPKEIFKEYHPSRKRNQPTTHKKRNTHTHASKKLGNAQIVMVIRLTIITTIMWVLIGCMQMRARVPRLESG